MKKIVSFKSDLGIMHLGAVIHENSLSVFIEVLLVSKNKIFGSKHLYRTGKKIKIKRKRVVRVWPQNVFPVI